MSSASPLGKSSTYRLSHAKRPRRCSACEVIFTAFQYFPFSTAPPIIAMGGAANEC